METALVAVADAQHSPGSREMAETAYEGLLAWLERETPRRLGDDAAAVALAARAGRQLRGGATVLTAQAANLVAAACKAHDQLAPLHAALAAWALDPLIPDRSQTPWDQLRSTLQQFSRRGVNEALVLFTEAIADERRRPVASALADVAAVDRTEQCIMVWLLTAAVELQEHRGFGSDGELSPFLKRRAELLDRLVTSVTGEALVPDAVQDYDPFGPADDDLEGLHLFEAVMLDLALSGERSAQELITLDEAARREERAAARRRRVYSGLAGIAGVLVAGMTFAIEALAHASRHLEAGSALMLLMLGFSAGALFLRGTRTRWNLELLLTGFGLEALLALVLIIEGVRRKTFFGDDVAALIGIAGIGAPFFVQPLAARLLKK